MTKNDERIMNLRKQIEAKEKELKGSRPFQPVTNCSLSMFGQRWNLHTIGLEQAEYILVLLNTFHMSAEDLGLSAVRIEGYTIDEWMQDVNNKMADVVTKQERAKLSNMYTKLETLLSAEKQTELAIDEIEGLL